MRELYAIDIYFERATKAAGGKVKILQEIEVSGIRPHRIIERIYKDLPLAGQSSAYHRL